MEFYECGAMNMLVEVPSEKRFRASPYVVTKDTLIPASNISFKKEGETYRIEHKTKIEETTFETYKVEGECAYVIHMEPFKVEGYYNKQLAFTINRKQLLNYDYHKSFDKLLARARDSAELNLLLSGWEQYSLGRSVACPKGPQAVALDIAFHELPKCYGLPERYRKFHLESTARKLGKSEPYRLYNLDIFGDSEVNQSVYGSVPFVIANSAAKPHSAAFFWLNTSDTYVDYNQVENESLVHFISECGVIDCFTFLGTCGLDISNAFGRVTGKAYMPQFFALGYHQSRWDEDTQNDIEISSAMFKKTGIPCDCIWLDIEHSDSKKYFTWDHNLFPKPLEMIQKLKDEGRHLVIIADPHLKVDPSYDVYNKVVATGNLVIY